MFGHRPDGKLVKTHSGLYLLMPHVMPKRYDSMNLCEFDVNMENLDKFIKEERERTGIVYSYLEIIVAAMVRIIYQRPELNRFIVNKRIYQRNDIEYSMALQRSLRPGKESDETTIKIKFEGNESLPQIKQMIEENIKNAKFSRNETDKLCATLAKIPNFIMGLAVGALKLMDRYGILPKSIIDAQPFHTSFWITDLRSVKCPSVYHHVYQFGTTGMFMSLGMEKCQAFFEKDGTVTHHRVMPVKFTSDERFCDGFYFARSLNIVQKFLRDPSLLLKPLDPPVYSKKEQKRRDKEKAKKEKALAKQKKKYEEENFKKESE